MSVLASEQMRETVQALLDSLEASLETAARAEGHGSPIIAEIREILNEIRDALPSSAPERQNNRGPVLRVTQGWSGPS